MEELVFHEGLVPSDFILDYEVSLFNLPVHRALQSANNWISYCLLHKKNKTALAEIHFHFFEGVASSPFRASFGSIDCSSKIPTSDLFQFLKSVEESIRLKGGTKIVIKNPPQIYHPYVYNLLSVFLLNLGYSIECAELGAVRFVDLPFEDRLDTWEKRKLRQGHDAGLELKQLDMTRLEEAYTFIQECRSKKGYTLSMSLDQVQQINLTLPNRLLLMGVYHKGVLVAASICIGVRSNVLYNFYSDHDKSVDQLSPVVFLMEGLYDYAQVNKISLVDFGTSAVEGMPNFGLLDFKLRLGASPTGKFTFEKKLN